MAQRIVTDLIEEITSFGYTAAELEARLGSDIYIDGDTWLAYGRKGQGKVEDILREARAKAAARRRAAALEAGRVEWRKVAGSWVLAGKDLKPGKLVEVFRRDGTSTTEVVGDVIGVKDGITLARTGTLEVDA